MGIVRVVHATLSNTIWLFFLALGLWGLFNAARKRGVDGDQPSRIRLLYSEFSIHHDQAESIIPFVQEHHDGRPVDVRYRARRQQRGLLRKRGVIRPQLTYEEVVNASLIP